MTKKNKASQADIHDEVLKKKAEDAAQTNENCETEEEQSVDCQVEEQEEDCETTEECIDKDKKSSKAVDMQDAIEKLQATIEEEKDKYLRLSAEFDNYRKRTLKEKAELILNGGQKSITNILPVIDDFERALQTMEAATDIDAIKTGVDLIYDKLLKTLAADGVKIIETQEQPLNTDFHEAIAVIPAPTEELKGKIIDCVQTGYLLNDKVIRHAKVVVGE